MQGVTSVINLDIKLLFTKPYLINMRKMLKLLTKMMKIKIFAATSVSIRDSSIIGTLVIVAYTI